jgi:hypothetical protein
MECGTFNRPRYSSIVSDGQGGCSQCSTSGFRGDKPALIYLMMHAAKQAAKAGICNIGTGRMDKHARNGWTPHATYRFDLGEHARAVEKMTVATWRARGSDWQEARVPEANKYDGFTETVSLVRADGRLTSLTELWDDVLSSIAATPMLALSQPRPVADTELGQVPVVVEETDSEGQTAGHTGHLDR